ncbi:MAG: SPOR domain-containing protein [Clostridia bacterium]|nr:SPOR domain-containing protein [Clostridia bacterium]
MEYKRNRRRSKARRSRKETGEAGRAFIAICMVAAIVYLVSASAAGTWIAQNVVVPVFSAVERFKPAQTETPPADAAEASEGAMQVALDTSRKAVDADMTLPAVTCYALQMGVYASEENALSQSAQLKKMGGGGYVLKDADRYRVIAAGYAAEADARSVKDRLVEQGVDCALYTFSTDAATYRVSAQEEQLASVRAGFAAIANAQQALTDCVLSFDAGKLGVAEGKAEAGRIADTLKADMALLSGYEGEQTTLSSLLSCYNDALSAIEKAAKSDVADTSAFAAELKYAQLYVTDRYAAFMRELY